MQFGKRQIFRFCAGTEAAETIEKMNGNQRMVEIESWQMELTRMQNWRLKTVERKTSSSRMREKVAHDKSSSMRWPSV